MSFDGFPPEAEGKADGSPQRTVFHDLLAFFDFFVTTKNGNGIYIYIIIYIYINKYSTKMNI